MEKKKRFNIIDVIIIVLILGAVSALVIRYNLVGKIVVDNKRDEVQISFIATGVSPEIADSIEDGSEFFTEGNGKSIGVLQNHTVNEAKTVISNELGNPVIGSDKTKRDIKGVLKTSGVMSDDGFMLDGVTFLCAGKSLTIQSLRGQFAVIITEITLVK